MKFNINTIAIAIISSFIALVPAISMAQDSTTVTQDNAASKTYTVETSANEPQPEQVDIFGKPVTPVASGAYIITEAGDSVPVGSTVTDASTSYHVINKESLKPGANFIRSLGGDPHVLYHSVITTTAAAGSDNSKNYKTIYVFKTQKTGDGFGTQFINGNLYVTKLISDRKLKNNLAKFYNQYIKAAPSTNFLYLKIPTNSCYYTYNPSNNITEHTTVYYGNNPIPKNLICNQ